METDTPSPSPHVPMIRQEPLVVAGFLVATFNFLVVFMLETASYVMPMIVLGAIAAEIALLATWGVFSSRSTRQRLLISGATGVFLFGCSASAVLLSTGFDPMAVKYFVYILMLCPLILFAVEAPLFAARIWFRLEVGLAGQPSRGSYLTPVQIKDLIVGTTVIGIALALVKEAPRLLDISVDQSFFVGLLVYCCVGALISLATVIPLIVFTLSERYNWRVIGSLLLWVAILFGAIRTVTMIPSPNANQLFNAVFLSTAVFVGMVTAALLFVRVHGYRLRRSRRGMTA